MRILGALGIGLVLLLVSFSNPYADSQAEAEFSNDFEYLRSISGRNFPGFQEDSIHTSSTISLGSNFGCSVHQSGDVSCWGSNLTGRLGNNYNGNQATPVKIANMVFGKTAVSLSSGLAHTCAILNDGSVACWGSGSHGQLGNMGTSNKVLPTLTMVFGPSLKATTISSGDFHTCAIDEYGDIWCWGMGNSGRLGNGDANNRIIPTRTLSLGNNNSATSISAGGTHTCAVIDNGDAYCWGDWYGRTPLRISGIESGQVVVAISSGNDHTCAILGNGKISCWSEGSVGQLGNGIPADAYSPQVHLGFGQGKTAIAISSGRDHSCAIVNDGSVFCWGDNDYGQFGNGNTSSINSIPQVTNSFGVGKIAIGIASGGHSTCALLSDSSVQCWGRGNSGQLGIGNFSTMYTPTEVTTFSQSDTIKISERDYDDDNILNMFEGLFCKPGHYYQNEDCHEAEPGYYSSGYTSTKQIPCPSGTYNSNSGSNSSTDCLFVDAGHYTNSSNGTGHANQIPCPSGTYQPLTGQDFCLEADLGHYVNPELGLGQVSQSKCPSGTFQNETGQSECKIADPGHFIPLESQPGLIHQTPCPVGTYQPLAGKSDCQVASIGHYLNLLLPPGQYEQIPCPLGTYQNETGMNSCKIAQAGYYVDNSQGLAQKWQTACPAGSYNPDIGASSVNDCKYADAGNYVDFNLGKGMTEQTPCPVGTFNPKAGSILQKYCQKADAGFYVDENLGVGQTSQTICPSGTYNPFSGAKNPSKCIETNPGHFTDSSNGTGPEYPMPCPAGTYQPNSGQSSCIKSDPGHYTPWSGFSDQRECEKGTYQPESGMANCIEAEPGYYVNSNGQISQEKCPTGTYSDNNGAIECKNPGLGYFIADRAGTMISPCPKFTYTYQLNETHGYNSVDSTSCRKDSDQDGLVDDNNAWNADLDDDNDGYNDSIDRFPNDPNEWADLNLDGIGDNSKPLTFFERIWYEVDEPWTLYQLVLIPALVVGLLLARIKVKQIESLEVQSEVSRLNKAIYSSNKLPPIPEKGIPVGFDLENWIKYGNKWLELGQEEE